MKKEKDWFGLWYTIMKERGENDCPTFGRLNLETHQIEWNHFSHSEMDGIGALKRYYDSKNIALKCPAIKEKFSPRPIQALLILYRLALTPKKIKTQWRVFDPSAIPTDHHAIEWIIFRESETKAIGDLCKKNKISENAFLLNTSSRILLDELSVNGEGTWTFPVNLRPMLSRSDFNSNHSSGILVPVKRSDSAKVTHEEIRQGLKKKEHWGIWWVHQIGKIVGLRGMRLISNRNSKRNFFAGTFSNLGQWDLPPNDIWIGSPPGSKNFPIGIMIFKANGRMSLSLKIHPSILPSHINQALLIYRLKDAILKEVAINS